MKTKIILSVLATCSIMIGFAAYKTSQPKPWTVPADFDKKANPIKSDAESIAAGKSVWTKHCSSCHGKLGQGDGSKAATLKTTLGDFSAASFQGQSDGALFYKTSKGRDDMPSFEKKIPDADDIWSVVNYMRTFKK